MSFHYEELYTLLTNNLKFDILYISETRLKLSKTSLTSISLPGYNIEYTTTELSNGSILIYIKNDIKDKLRKDLQIYKSKELKSTFYRGYSTRQKQKHWLYLLSPSDGTLRI